MVTAVLWVAISLVGFVFAAIDVVDAYSHYNLVRMGWPEHERLAGFTRNQFFSQAARMVLLLVFLILGINALLDGPQGVSIYAMFIGNLIVVAAAIKSHRYRRQVFREERSEYREREDAERRERWAREDASRSERRAQEDENRGKQRSQEDRMDSEMDALRERSETMKEKEQDSE